MVESGSPSRIEADLARLEDGIRQLKLQYDMFFSGAIPRQPFEMRTQFEQLIRRYANAPIRKYAHRFHYNAIVSRFNSLSEHWAKTLRSIEEGNRPAPALLDRQGKGAGERVVTTCHLRDLTNQREALQILHECFLEARRKVGVLNSQVSLESFIRGISVQAQRLREKSGCSEVELRLVIENRNVHLKARPGR